MGKILVKLPYLVACGTQELRFLHPVILQPLLNVFVFFFYPRFYGCLQF